VSLRASDSKLTTRVGAAAIVVLLLAVGYLLFLRGRLFLGPAVHVGVYFEHVGSLKEGAPVIVAGRQVGKVETIRLVSAKSDEAAQLLGGAAGAVAQIRIDASLRGMVPYNGAFFVSSKGLLAERYLEVGPPPDGAEVERLVADGDRVRGADPASMDRVLQNMWTNLTIARKFLEEVGPEARALFGRLGLLSYTLDDVLPPRAELDAMLDRGRALADQATTTFDLLESGAARPEDVLALADRAQRTMADITKATAIIRARLDALGASFDRVRGQIEAARPGLEKKIREALASVDTAMAKMESLSAKVADLMGIIARGEGSLMRIQRDPEFPEDAKELGKILKRTPWRVVGHPQDDEP